MVSLCVEFKNGIAVSSLFDIYDIIKKNGGEGFMFDTEKPNKEKKPCPSREYDTPCKNQGKCHLCTRSAPPVLSDLWKPLQVSEGKEKG